MKKNKRKFWRCGGFGEIWINGWITDDGRRQSQAELKINKIQKIKILKKKKLSLKIWCICAFPQNLALIHLTVSKKEYYG